MGPRDGSTRSSACVVGEVGYSADFTGASSSEARRIADLAPGFDPEHDTADHLSAQQHEDFVLAAVALIACLRPSSSPDGARPAHGACW